jgi:hypothetical protein
MLIIDYSAGEALIEFLTSQVDGVRTAFTTTNSFNSVTRLFRNGNLLEEGDDYSVVAPNTIIFSRPPKVHSLDGKDKIRAELN